MTAPFAAMGPRAVTFAQDYRAQELRAADGGRVTGHRRRRVVSRLRHPIAATALRHVVLAGVPQRKRGVRRQRRPGEPEVGI